MYACMYQELLKNHNKFLVCCAHLANKADSDSDSDSDDFKALHIPPLKIVA